MTVEGDPMALEHCEIVLKEMTAERDKLLLQNDELKKAMQNALISLTKNCRCEGCDCDQKHAAEVLEAALTEKRNCEHEWIGGSMEGYRCTKCPAVAGKYCGVCHEPMEGNRMGPCWKCQPKVIDAGARCGSERRNEQCAKHQGHDGKHGFGLNEWS